MINTVYLISLILAFNPVFIGLIGSHIIESCSDKASKLTPPDLKLRYPEPNYFYLSNYIHLISPTLLGENLVKTVK